RQRFSHVLVDEYQDTNHAQNEIVLMLTGDHGQVTVVGDTDQCVPAGTLIATPDGPRCVEEGAIGDVVLGASQHAPTEAKPVTHVFAGRYAGPLVKVTVGDRTLRTTPEHLVPMRLVPHGETWLVYLMYRADMGWRIGRTVGARPYQKGVT